MRTADLVQGLENRLAARVAQPRWRLPAGRGVALTFDDGPDPEWTPRVLDLLAEHGAKATFFLVGERAQRESALVQRMLTEGHGVGSHSMAHEHLLALDSRRLFDAVVGGRDAVEQAAGRLCPLFRPPRGHLDLRVARLVRRYGLQMWMWSLDTGDWREGSTPKTVLTAADGLVEGDVVLLHDALAGDDAAEAARPRAATLAALPELLARMTDHLGPAVLPQSGGRAVTT